MNDGRVYVATFSATVIGTAAQSIMEVQVPDNTIIEVLRAWLSPGITATPVDEVINIALYGNDGVATSGSAMTEQPLTPAAAADASNCVALLEPTIAASPLDLHVEAYHLQNSWPEQPIPEEMSVFIGGNADPGDNVGIRLVTASTATPTLSGGIKWKEISAA